MEIVDITEQNWKRAFARARVLKPFCQSFKIWTSHLGWGIAYRVNSTSTVGVDYLVDFKQIGTQLFITCNCLAGQNDHPCVHAARVLLFDVDLKEYVAKLRKGEPIVSVSFN